jgi:predicted  nucleic acid-binding Zn-ribbon protein
MSADLEQLARLSDLDMALTRAKTVLKAARASVGSAEDALRASAADRDEVQAEFNAAKQAERDANRRLAQYQNRLGRALKVLETGVGNPEAAERQRVQCLEIIDRIETEILEAMEVQEEIQPRLDAAIASVNAAEQALAKARETSPARIATVTEEIRELRTAHDAIHITLDREVQGRYDLLRARKPPAVARIHHNACKLCMFTVPKQATIEMKRGRLMTCRGCGRWLYPEQRA